jgi:hypothetical protein
MYLITLSWARGLVGMGTLLGIQLFDSRGERGKGKGIRTKKIRASFKATIVYRGSDDNLFILKLDHLWR